jgi:DNA-binding NtrC family response regulator
VANHVGERAVRSNSSGDQRSLDRGSEVGPAGAVEDGASLLTELRRAPADLLLLDLRLPDQSGIELLPRIKEIDAQLPVIIMTAFGEIETAVAAVRAGAYHFLEKPVKLPELLLLIEQALETRQLRGEVDRLRAGYRWQFADVALVGRSAALRRVAQLIARIGAKGSPVNVLLRGESGTGKDVVARAIHAQGPRCSQPFVNINCTALPDQLIESELFGHESGAYTDAREMKRGLFEVAHKGTIFLDEIGDIARPMQAKLLHFLEAHEFRRVGGVRSFNVDVHVITATNRHLEEAVARGDFREDLFYRLNIMPILIPPLRERPEDVAPLALHFVETMCRDVGQPRREIRDDVLKALEAYQWPGNVRELRNVIERVLLLEDDDEIRLEHLPPNIRGDAPVSDKTFILPASGIDFEAMERDLI